MLKKIKEVFDGDAIQKMAYCGVLRFSGLKYIEISKETNTIMPTVKTRLHRHWKLYKDDLSYRRDIDLIVKEISCKN